MFAALERDKSWFLDILSRFKPSQSRNDGTTARRIRSVAAACPEMGRAEIAELLGVNRSTVTDALTQKLASPFKVSA